MKACTQLGWSHVPVTVIDLDKVVLGELAENIGRKDFTPSEVVAITEAVRKRERELARRRQTLGKVSTRSDAGKTRDKLDKITTPLGLSARTLEKARAVVAAADAEPSKYGKLKDVMDRTGRVNGVFRQLKIARQVEAIQAGPPPLPGNGPYRVIVADPPWSYEKRSEDPSHRPMPYPSMSLESIRALDVASLAHDDCILWLWTTNAHIRDAFTVLDAWGFEHKTILTWGKDHHRKTGYGLGDWLRGQTEHCLMATRGKPTVTLTNQTTLLLAPAGRHSEKPVEFYDFVESLCPAPRYAYLFSRYRHNDRWDCHGDEAPGGEMRRVSNF